MTVRAVARFPREHDAWSWLIGFVMGFSLGVVVMVVFT